MKPEYLELLKAGLGLLVALITLAVGWFIGQRLTVNWNLFQKRRETDIANVQQFHSLYGEFKEISKLWRVMRRNKDVGLEIPRESRWLLLARACAVESKNETIMVKVATERCLSKDDMITLGLFRQALQKLRESLRDDEEIPFSSRGPEYVFFNALAAQVTSIISSARPATKVNPTAASANLETIANIRLRDFEAAIARFKREHPEHGGEEA